MSADVSLRIEMFMRAILFHTKYGSQFAVSLDAHRRSRASLEEPLMNPRNLGILASLAIIAGARAANADTPADSPWGIAVYGGDTVTEAGRLRSPLSSTIPDLGALNPQFSGTSGTLSLDKLRYDDLFRQDFATGIELNYSFSPNLQTYGRLGYATLDGETRRIGFLSTAALGGSEDL